MSPALPDPLTLAFEAAAGRGPEARVAPAWSGFARRVVAAGRALLVAEPCPRATVRRAEALFGTPRTAVARLLGLVVDSWSGLLPAFRGRGPRLLRYSDAGLELDVELEPLAGGRTRLRVALTPAAGHAVVVVQGRHTRRLPVDSHGAAETTLSGRGQARVRVVRGRRVVARTPPLPRT